MGKRWLYGVVVLLGCLLLRGMASANEISFELESVCDEKLGGGCADGCAHCCNGAGTLFLWSCGTGATGGPDLSEPLVTDRPDFTESSVTVGRGVAQIEMGYTYGYDHAQTTSIRTDSGPEMLLRYGMLADWFELRIGWNYLEERTRTPASSNTLTGADDLSVGFKVGLTPQDGWLPEMALIGQMTVPSGSSPFNNGEVLPAINWAYGWELSDRLAMGGNSQIQTALDPVTDEEFIYFTQSWAVGMALTEKVGGYVEWYAFFPSGADSAPPEHYFNGGFTYLVHNDLQLDVRAGLGLNSPAEDYFVGTGASIRF